MKEHLRIYGLGIALIIGGFIFASQFIRPAPPKNITIATGAKTGAYFSFAKKYQAILAREGIRLHIVNTEGSIENLQHLSSGEVDIAFVQSGTGLDFTKKHAQLESNVNPEADQSLVSLASLYYEPLWGFLLNGKKIDNINDLKDKSVAIGLEGSGSFSIANLLLASNGIDNSLLSPLSLSNDEAAQKLLAGSLDFMFMVASIEAPLVQQLLHSASVIPFDFERAEAYTRRYRFLSTVNLPQGVVDLGRNIPSQNTHLLAAAATLAVRADLHPALIALLMQAIEEVHSGGGLFEDPGQFPSRYYTDFPLSASAERHFEHGPPLLQRYLPFWLAVLVDQLKVFLVPIIALMIPLLRILPPIYRWRVRSRIYRWYRELREIEWQANDDDNKGESNDGKRAQLLERLEQLHFDVMQESVPLSYNDELYHLRMHIGVVRDTLTRR